MIKLFKEKNDVIYLIKWRIKDQIHKILLSSYISDDVQDRCVEELYMRSVVAIRCFDCLFERLAFQIISEKFVMEDVIWREMVYYD